MPNLQFSYFLRLQAYLTPWISNDSFVIVGAAHHLIGLAGPVFLAVNFFLLIAYLHCIV